MLKIVFEDQYLMVIDKPPGLVVTRSETQNGNTLEDILRKDYSINIDRGGIVHRLDKYTSGLLVIGKTDEVVKRLQAQFKNREVKKEYLSLVHGWITSEGRVEAPIGRNPKDSGKFTVLQQGGKHSTTEYQPISKYQIPAAKFQALFSDLNKKQLKKLQRMGYNRFTLLRCFPLSGRTHQIRVHLKYAGFPAVGDDKYAGRKIVRLDHRWVNRQFLHASKLKFTHPVRGEWLVCESKLPYELEYVLKYLEKLGDWKP